MKRLGGLILVLTVAISLCACGSETVEPKLSSSCDYVLSEGKDKENNHYELVANQKETSLGYEITVGVIKNNEWICPLTTDFPFLGEKGLFHVTAPQGESSGSNLKDPRTVSSAIHFIDTGAFVMESFNTLTATALKQYDHTMIFYSCSTLKSRTIDYDEYNILYLQDDFGEIYTDNGKILLYSEISGTSSGWLKDQVFDWCFFNPKTLDIETFGHSVAGVRPESVLSEGLIFASDKCFYNTNIQKVIDLSAYNIIGDNLYFKNGICTFKTKNALKSEFLVTIDTSGKVLSEVKQ